MAKIAEERDVLTPEQAAELLQVSVFHVRELARQGTIPARKIGRVWRFSRRQLIEWLEQTEPRNEGRPEP